MSHQKSSTSVHPIETSDPRTKKPHYRELKYRNLIPAFEVARDLYEHIDSVELTRRHQQIDSCREYVYYSKNTETNEVRIIANACKLRWCPICGKAKQWNISKSVTKWLTTVKNPKFVTLTLKHSQSPLSSQICKLYESFRLLRKTKLWKNNVAGGIWFFQVKRSEKSGEWHPHLHILIDAQYIPQKSLSECWERCTKGSTIADIRSARSAKAITDYVARYCALPANLLDYDWPDRFTIFRAMHGRRICGKFGTARIVTLSAFKAVDPEKWENLGSYNEIQRKARFSLKARIVIDACIKQKALPNGFTMYDVRENQEIDSQYQSFLDNQKRKQLYFEEFR